MKERVGVTIDGKTIKVDAGTTILEAARSLGIEIPTLCYLDGKERLESCGICGVAIEGQPSFVPACASRVQEGMRVRTDSEEIAETRKLALELLLSDHLGDCIAPCERACPAGIDIPGFLRHIRDGHPGKSLEVILEKIAFPGVLGRVCPKFCERICRRGEVDEPVAICTLKRHPADSDERSADRFIPPRKPSSGKKVAIVGAGIVGLTAAYYLLREGHECILYESRERPGGALDSIIPEFRLPRRVVRTEVHRIESMGAEIRYHQSLGKDFGLDDLRRNSDAVLLAFGASKERLPDLPGGEGTPSALGLLQQAAEGSLPEISGTCVVTGSGPTAMDACRTLLRAGANESILLMEPPATASLFFKTWIPDGVAEGVQLLDRASHVRLQRREDGGFGCRFERNGRSEVLFADHVFRAGHVEPDLEFLKSLGLETTTQGVRVDRRSLTTSIEGVFAAGNIAQAGRYAVQGSAAGRKVAFSISRFLYGDKKPPKKPIDVRLPRLSAEEKEVFLAGHSDRSRVPNAKRTHTGKRGDFSETDRGIPDERASQEAGRCLGCDCAAKKDCSLRDLATRFGADPNAFAGERPPFERDCSHPDIVYESGKCIKCGRCIARVEEKSVPLGLTYIGRGFRVRVGVPFEAGLEKGLGITALECADNCPTGALSRRR